MKSNREKHGATAVKTKPKAKPADARSPTRAVPKPVDEKAVMAASVARREKVEREKTAAKAAAELAARKAADLEGAQGRGPQEAPR